MPFKKQDANNNDENDRLLNTQQINTSKYNEIIEQHIDTELYVIDESFEEEEEINSDTEEIVYDGRRNVIRCVILSCIIIMMVFISAGTLSILVAKRKK